MSANDETLSFDDDVAQVNRPIVRLFTRYGRDHVRLLLIAIGTSLIYPVASLIPVFVLQRAIDGILLATEPFSLPGVPANEIPPSPESQLLLVAGIIIATALISASLNAISAMAWGRFAVDVQHRLRSETYDCLQRREYAFFDQHEPGQLMSILNEDIENLNRLLEQLLRDLIELIVRFLGIGTILVVLHWQFALVALTVIPVLSILARLFVARIRPTYQALRDRIGMVNARVENNLGGIAVIKAGPSEDYEAHRVRRVSQAVAESRWSVIRTQAAFFPTMHAVNWGWFGLLVALGGTWYLQGPPGPFTMDLSVGILVAFLLYNQQLTTPVMEAGHLLDLYFESRASLERIQAVQRGEERHDTAGMPIETLDAPIEISQLRFDYGESPVLRGIELRIEPGLFVGIVGTSGSGKTTLVQLLLRLYDPTSGRIRIDGTDTREIDPHSLRACIGLVTQEPIVFAGTIRENVAYDTEDPTAGAIKTALRHAGAWSFVAELERGLDTPVGPGGASLSGGQRQRLAIARALLQDPDLLILDEALSHVDPETEAHIQAALDDHDATVIVIAHRLSTVRQADRILVLEDGRILERGTHASLLAADGRYAHLWKLHVGSPFDEAAPLQ